MTTSTRAGFAALIGAPNAGKSTLLNQLIGQKLSIVSAKAQTTRMRVLGLLTIDQTQIGLLDTPGIFAKATGSSKKLEQAMLQAAWGALEDADAIVLLVDASARQPDTQTEAIVETLKKQKRRAVLVLNKVDKVQPEKLLPLTEALNKTELFSDIFMVSALTGDGVDKLKDHLAAAMPEGPWLFPEDQLSDVSERLLAAEITREQLFFQLREELPYAAAVIPESWETKKDGSAVIHQTILVSRVNHRAIVLGKNGAQIKAIGQAAREEMRKQFGYPVHLFLQVKFDENWQEKREFYRLFGLDK